MPRRTSYTPQSSSSPSECEVCGEYESYGTRNWQGHHLCYPCYELAIDGEDFWLEEEERHELF